MGNVKNAMLDLSAAMLREGLNGDFEIVVFLTELERIYTQQIHMNFVIVKVLVIMK